MRRKIVLLLQGGGALGAFQCGAWKAIQAFMRDTGSELTAIAGASIGAINAGLIARHLHDPGGPEEALDRFWREDLPNPPLPFIPLPGEYWQAWNGLLTGLLTGNPALFRPLYHHWNPVGEALRFWMPMYDIGNAARRMSSAFGRYRGNAPLLMVGATDVRSGEAMLFDSVRGRITPQMLAASIAIPILFSPVKIDGRYYWDGEIRSETLLPHVLHRLSETLPPDAAPQDLLVIVVDMFSASATSLPWSTIASHYRLMNVVLGGKLKYDRAVLDVRNAYLNAIERLHTLAREHPASPLAAAIEAEYRKLGADRYGRVEIVHIGREPFRYEHISRDFDYSPHYLRRLIEQGYANGCKALAACQTAQSVAVAQQSASITDIRNRRP